MQKNTNIMQQQKQVEMMRKRVCYLLNWTVEEYNKYQRKQGCLYLQLKMSGSPQIIDELVESEMFWAWWKNEWAHREYVYVNSADILYLPNRLKLYYHYNDAEILV